MSWIFIFFFLTYGSIHYYIFSHVKAALQLSLPYVIILAVFLALMVISPVLVPVFERHFGHRFARTFAYATYCWMGLAFFFFCISCIIDFYRLILYGAVRFWTAPPFLFLPSIKTSFLITLFCSLLFLTYGLFEAQDIRLKSLVVKSVKLPGSLARIRVVQISDLHIGLIMQGERLKKVIAKIKEANPDILVSTGDLVDGQGDSLLAQYSAFQGITPRFGKFAVTGNHEYYAGVDRSLDFTRHAGFYVLRAEGLTVKNTINIAGLDDVVVRRGEGETARDISFRKTLDDLPRDKFTLFLYHRPTIDPSYLGKFDLQLSAHTHGGQIYPFSLVTGLLFPMQTGYFTLPHHSSLYVSRGTGTWGPPVRFFAPPEVTVIDLVPDK